jgi:riboflavin kinase/FMN adenylyltransferase
VDAKPILDHAPRALVQRDERALPPGTAACLGAFDGTHLGHQALFARARAVAPQLAIVTFDPHPLQVLAPERAPRRLQTEVQRERVARWLGVDALVLLPFDREMAALEPDAFVQRYLVAGLRPAAVVVGEDFRFGAGRRGDADARRRALAPAGIGVEVIAAVPPPGEPTGGKLSSSAIRRALEHGDVATAGALLGRWHSVAGRVIVGERRGRTLGFPTANVDAPGGFLPATGIYATVLSVWDRGSPDFGARWPSVASLGTNPTFGEGLPAPRLEVFVLDRELGERLYGVEVEVAFVERLRDEARFDSVDALVRRIRDDVAAARARLDDAALARVVPPS